MLERHEVECIFSDILDKLSFRKKWCNVPSNLNKFDVAKYYESAICNSSTIFFPVDPGKNHLTDLVLGDIHAGDTFIDIKVGESKYAGAVSPNSAKSFRGDYYVCMDKDATHFYVVTPDEMRRFFSKNPECEYAGEMNCFKYIAKEVRIDA